MKNKYFLIVIGVFLASAVFAQTTSVWNPAGNPTSTGLWSEAANWTGGIVPEGSYKVVFNVPDSRTCILDNAKSIVQLVMADGGRGDTLRIKNGGSLTTTAGWSGIGWTDTATLIVEKGGVVTFAEHLWLGWGVKSLGTVILSGVMNVTQMYATAFEGGGGKGLMYVKEGGVLNLNGFDPVKSIPDGSLMEISDSSVVKIKGDKRTAVNSYAAAGKIVGKGGSGEIGAKFDAVANITTVYVLPVRQATTVWNPGVNSSGLWTDAENWSDGNTPLDNKVVLNVPGAKDCVLNDSASILQFVLGDGGDGGVLRIASGGVLNTGVMWSGIAWSHPAKLVVDNGGEISFGEHMWVGWGGDATVEISGKVSVAQMYGTAFEGGAGTGYTTVKAGGVLNLAQLHPDKSIPEGSFLDVSGGKIMIKGNQTAKVEAYIVLGRILADEGVSDVNISYEIVGTDTLNTILQSSASVSIRDVRSKIGHVIYPNPATDVIFLKDNIVADVRIYSANGQLVLTKLQTSTVNIGSLKTGFYIVKVGSNKNNYVDRLIKKE